MELTRYVDDLQNRLATAAEAGGQDSRELAQRLLAPLDAAVRLVLLDALSFATGEISAELSPGSVDLRLRGGEPEFVVSLPEASSAPDEAAATRTAAGPGLSPVVESDEGATTRTTLRLPDQLKAQVEVAAARDGISVNSWLVRAVSAALEQTPARTTATPQRGGNRVTGWVR